MGCENFPFACVVLASLAIAAYLLWIRPGAEVNGLTGEENGEKGRSLARVLFALALCQIFQIAIVCKHYESRYLIPSVGLIGANLLLLHSLLKPPIWQRFFCVGWIALASCG